MRVLWFANTPSMAEEYIYNKPSGGGWIKSLEKELKNVKEISKLGIVFYHKERLNNFVYKDTFYYPLFLGKSNIVVKLIEKVKGTVLNESEIPQYLAIIEEFKPDIIHIHGTEMPFGLLQEFTNIPVAISIQGNLSAYLEKYYIGISKKNISKFTSLRNKLSFKSYNYNYKKFKEKAYIEKKVLRITQNIIGRTAWDFRVTRILTKSSNYFHNDEILRDSFYKAKWCNELNAEVKLYTTIGTAIYKGLETLLLVAKYLEDKDLNFKWNIGGLSKNDPLVKIVLRSLNIKLSPNVYFLGRLDEEQIVSELLDSNIYIMPSHIENSPNNLCEAMILGVPCIATYAGGTGSLIHDRETGIIVQDGDSYAMSGAIIEMILDYPKAISLGKKARVLALERHSKKKIIKELIEIYKTLSNS